MTQDASPIFSRPDSEQNISAKASQLLKKADALGCLPTPIDDLIETAKITEISSLDELQDSFLSRLKNAAKETFKSAIQKVRGIADLRDRVIYIPRQDNPLRQVFPKAHDLGHQVLPWHTINPAYLDDDITLSPDIEDQWEKEANFFASEIIFQGDKFKTLARDYSASFNAIFKLADLHGASVQSTVWRYVEDQDETIAIAHYYPTNALDDEGERVLKLWKTIPSTKFYKKYKNICLPTCLRTGHQWVAARDTSIVCDGKETLHCDENRYNFEWQSWWNGYTLFILLRRAPSLKIIRSQ